MNDFYSKGMKIQMGLLYCLFSIEYIELRWVFYLIYFKSEFPDTFLVGENQITVFSASFSEN